LLASEKNAELFFGVVRDGEMQDYIIEGSISILFVRAEMYYITSYRYSAI